MIPSSSRVQRWRRWFERVNHEVAHLVACEHMRKELWQVIGQSPVASRSHPLWGYLNYALTDEVILRICRLSEKQSFRGFRLSKRSVCSLDAMLEEFERYSDYFSRRRYVGRLREPARLDYSKLGPGAHSAPLDKWDHFRIRTNAFDGIAGKGKSVLDRKRIAMDRKRLRREIKRVEHFRNKFVAHNDLRQRGRKGLPFAEIDRSIQAIVKIARKYFLLLTRSEFVFETFRPGMPALFLEPWVESRGIATMLDRRFEAAAREFKNKYSDVKMRS